MFAVPQNTFYFTSEDKIVIFQITNIQGVSGEIVNIVGGVLLSTNSI